ncbi:MULTISPECIES: hypothetical protein [unclassified Paenibacillus]|uniref:hypothetical protein n=1 Tax=unclassified Paenibacillus TaxID=185978 RepID=UPI003634A8F5
MIPIKIYIHRNRGKWELTDKITSELASVRHLEESIRNGEKPFLHEVRVEEGSYKWNPTEHQYELQIHSRSIEPTNGKNMVAQMINLLGFVVIIFGFIAGFLRLPNGILAVTFIFSGIVTGLLIVGFSEVIYLLDKINKKMNKD